MEIKVVFEDGDLLVIEKPAGVVVNRAKTVKEKTVQDWAEKKLKVKSQKSKVEEGDFVERSGIVHRLDKETSGLLVIAKDAQAFANLQAQFKTRKTQKKYFSLVHGEVKPKEGKIELPIARNPFNHKKFGIFLGGRKAVTEYRVISNLNPFEVDAEQSRSIKSQTMKQNKVRFMAMNRPKVWFKVSNLTFLELTPLTGRTHQIRVHLKAIGHPVVADKTYAGRKTNRADRKWCPRMFLHASLLGFFHPRTKNWVEFESELPQDLKKVLQKLQQ